MSTHPNAILMAVLTPEGLSRQTMREILGKDYSRDNSNVVKIENVDYDALVMEKDYDEDFQIAAKEGDLVFYDLVTYGYGEVISWADLEAKKVSLEAWAREMAERHLCAFRIDVSANYW